MIVIMPVMKIGIVRMPVHHGHMPVPVSVRFSGRHTWIMRMEVMLVMRVPMLVLDELGELRAVPSPHFVAAE